MGKIKKIDFSGDEEADKQSIAQLLGIVKNKESVDTVTRQEKKMENHRSKRIELCLSKKHRAGKTVVVVKGLNANEMLLYLPVLKKKFACGGTIKDGDMLIQSTRRDEMFTFFCENGYKAVLVGG